MRIGSGSSIAYLSTASVHSKRQSIEGKLGMTNSSTNSPIVPLNSSGGATKIGRPAIVIFFDQNSNQRGTAPVLQSTVQCVTAKSRYHVIDSHTPPVSECRDSFHSIAMVPATLAMPPCPHARRPKASNDCRFSLATAEAALA